MGYGFGWRLMAGSITPYWSNYSTIHHYGYTDSAGAEYRLGVNTNGIWTSREGIYVFYAAAAQRLYFPDGSHGWYQSYHLDYNADPIPHATRLDFEMGLATHYHFNYSADQALYSPFTPQVAFGTVRLLTSVVKDDLNLTHQFTYGSNNAGELNQVTFPYGGILFWWHYDFTYLAPILFTLSAPLWGRLLACARPSGLAEAGLKAGCGLKGRPTQAQQRSTANAEDAALGRLSEQYCT